MKNLQPNEDTGRRTKAEGFVKHVAEALYAAAGFKRDTQSFGVDDLVALCKGYPVGSKYPAEPQLLC